MRRFLFMLSIIGLMAAGALPVFATGSGTNHVLGCPDDTELIAKFEWTSNGWQLETGGGVDIDGDAQSGDWESDEGVDVVIINGGNDSKSDSYDSATSGSYSNAGLENEGGQTPDISNILFCGDGEDDQEPTPGSVTIEGACVEDMPVFLWSLTGGSESSDALLTIEVALQFDSIDFTLFDDTLDAGETVDGVFGDDDAEKSALAGALGVRFRGNIGSIPLFDDHGELGHFRDFDIPECEESTTTTTQPDREDLACPGTLEIDQTVIRDSEGSEHVLLTVDVAAEAQGLEATVTAKAHNNSSVHPGNDLVVASGSGSVVLTDVERAPGAETAASGNLVLGTTLTVTLEMGEDGVFSGGMMLSVECPEETTSTTAPQVKDTSTTAPSSTSTTKAPSPDGDAGNPMPWAIPAGILAIIASLVGLVLRGRAN